MGRKINMVKIDGTKLRDAFRTRNIPIDRAGADVGFSKQYFRNACSRNIIAMPGVTLLEKVYDIPLSEYEQEPEPEYPTHAIVFDKSTPYYEDNPDYDITFVKHVAMLTEDHLKHDGFVLLADVYKNLGIEYPKNLSYNMGWDDPEKSVLFDLLIKKDAIVINCNANGALHSLENREYLPEFGSKKTGEVTLEDIYEKLDDISKLHFRMSEIEAALTEIRLALTKIGTLNAQMVDIWTPKKK